MNKKRRSDIKIAILRYMALNLEGNLLDWDNFKLWLSTELEIEEDDIAERVIRKEIQTLWKRLKKMEVI